MVTQRSWFLPSFTVLCIYIVVTRAIGTRYATAPPPGNHEPERLNQNETISKKKLMALRGLN